MASVIDRFAAGGLRVSHSPSAFLTESSVWEGAGGGREARERPQPKFTAHACAAALARTGAGRSVSLRASPACVSTRGAAHRGGGSLGRLSSGRWRCGSLSRGGYGVRWVVAVRVSGAWFAYLRAVACVRRGLGRLPG